MFSYIRYLNKNLIKRKSLWILSIIFVFFIGGLLLYGVNKANNSGSSFLNEQGSIIYGLIFTLVFLFSIIYYIMIATFVFKEGEESGVELTIISKPLVRWQIVLSKFIFTALAILAWSLMLMVLFSVIGFSDKYLTSGHRASLIASITLGSWIVGILLSSIYIMMSTFLSSKGTRTLGILLSSLILVGGLIVPSILGVRDELPRSGENRNGFYNSSTGELEADKKFSIEKYNPVGTGPNEGIEGHGWYNEYKNSVKYIKYSIFDPWYGINNFYGMFNDVDAKEKLVYDALDVSYTDVEISKMLRVEFLDNKKSLIYTGDGSPEYEVKNSDSDDYKNYKLDKISEKPIEIVDAMFNKAPNQGKTDEVFEKGFKGLTQFLLGIEIMKQKPGNETKTYAELIHEVGDVDKLMVHYDSDVKASIGVVKIWNYFIENRAASVTGDFTSDKSSDGVDFINKEYLKAHNKEIEYIFKDSSSVPAPYNIPGWYPKGKAPTALTSEDRVEIFQEIYKGANGKNTTIPSKNVSVISSFNDNDILTTKMKVYYLDEKATLFQSRTKIALIWSSIAILLLGFTVWIYFKRDFR